MKKLSKLKLNDFHEMTDMEMKNVVGGSGATTGCVGNKIGDSCINGKGKEGTCKGWPLGAPVCWT